MTATCFHEKIAIQSQIRIRQHAAATGKWLRICKLVIFNTLFALYLHFRMANIVQAERRTNLFEYFRGVVYIALKAKNKCNFFNIKAMSKQACRCSHIHATSASGFVKQTPRYKIVDKRAERKLACYPERRQFI